MNHFNILTTPASVFFLLKYIFFYWGRNLQRWVLLSADVLSTSNDDNRLQIKSKQKNKNKNKLTTFSLSFYYVGSTWKCQYKVFIRLSDSLL